ncbi:hypothetical protein [Hymenobacter metallicola]|uniref:Uncharacterized protein n=1 Tax=Hymenobacter metallicola TaxID=2563114 RepID=A0A4Z0QJ35_9BACT|nr:hypothetical protein [Hymenobacter metallicola]TGE29715.1 hypothetical protein E5K02_09730 [Hymenobacter metallicola]
MKKLVFLGVFLLALRASPVMAQTAGTDVVVVRIVDTVSGTGKLIIARPGDKTEEMKLNGGTNSSSMQEAALTIQHVTTGLYQEGYVLKSTFSGSGGFGATLIFVKEK